MPHITAFRTILMFSTILTAIPSFSVQFDFNEQSSTSALEEFIPPQQGCNVNWILETRLRCGCDWCEAIFNLLMEHLKQSYSLSTIYNSDWASHNWWEETEWDWAHDLKGTYFINWFMDSNFNELTGTMKLHGKNEYWSDDWFIFVEVSLYIF